MTEPRRFYSPGELSIMHQVEVVAHQFSALAFSCVERAGESEADVERMREISREVDAIVRRNAERRELHEGRKDADYERAYL
jgi:hypothetical protein